MIRVRQRGITRLRALLGLSCGAALLCAASPVRADSAVRERVLQLVRGVAERLDRGLMSRCLTPDAARVITELVARGRLQSALGEGFTLGKAAVGGDRIELEIRDPSQGSYAVTLALPGSRGGKEDGQGHLFLFYLEKAAGPLNPRATKALLAAGALIDAAIPETALERCTVGEQHRDRRYPRALILWSAAAQLVILLGAAVHGLREVREEVRRRNGKGREA